MSQRKTIANFLSPLTKLHIPVNCVYDFQQSVSWMAMNLFSMLLIFRSSSVNVGKDGGKYVFGLLLSFLKRWCYSQYARFC